MINVLVNNNLIKAYATTGSFSDGINVSEDNVPDNFISDFAVDKFIYTDDGDIIENPDYTEPVQPIKDNKIKEMSEACTQIIYNGIDIHLSNGEVQHFTLDEQDQANLSGIGLELAAGAEFITWHEDDQTKQCQFYSAQDATTIIQSLTVWKSYHITYFRDLRIYINSLTDIDEIKAIQYGFELPRVFKSAVLRYYEDIIKGA